MTQSFVAVLDTPTDLDPANRASATQALNVVLADLFVLYVKTKNFHWHMSGPHFRDYHLMLDEQATDIFGAIDEVAERVRKTGGRTLRSIGDIARHQSLRDNDADYVTPDAMLAELCHDNRALVQSLRQAKLLVDEARDNATSGIIDTWTDQAERRAWFLFEATRAA